MIIFKPHEIVTLLQKYLPENPIIVEAGAYNGNDTIRMAKAFPNGHIHAFEPVPEIMERLKIKTEQFPNISRYPYALSDHNGSALFYVSEKPEKPGVASQAGSLLKPKERMRHSPLHFPRTIQVPTITLDSWAKKENISRVDFLWLDMQGHELAVLKASHEIVPTVSVVFCEVSFIESYEKIPQVDEVTTWLQNNGFELVGQDYESSTSHFFGNRLFIRSR